MSQIDTRIENLGPCTLENPAGYAFYTSDESRVLYRSTFRTAYLKDHDFEKEIFFEEAGPRDKIFFNPEKVKVGVVTCGGLCPGLNDVIRALIMELVYRYKVKNIVGFRYGYEGLVERYGHTPVNLTPDMVTDIMQSGGSMLASSRGEQKVSEMIETIKKSEIDILFCVGGDGTLRGAYQIYEECKRINLRISVVGVPKTIDNDINYIERTFGFSTAVSEAVKAVNCAHVEAVGAPRGIGLVKLMGRHSGFIAANAALASKHVNFLLVPEKDFDLEGNNALFQMLGKRIEKRGHAVILVAEGAGQKFFQTDSGKDKSGNAKLGDIGVYLKDRITSYFKSINNEVNMKYIDPSYIIRSVPANPEDSIFCGFLGQNAVHAAMSGKTGMVVGIWNNVFTHVPIKLAIAERKVLKTEKSTLWRAVLSTTGMPDHLTSR